ncbi:MAG: hypothetical protein HY690_17290 [Chloroflexi bacterium]|nr:hypothetical protein [Chloroflexota bacterium]
MEHKPTAALAQEVVLLSSLLQANPPAASFGVMLRSLAEDPTGPNLARSAREVLAAWCAEKREARFQERRAPARYRRQVRLDGALAAARTNAAGNGHARSLLGRKGRRLLELHRRPTENHHTP